MSKARRFVRSFWPPRRGRDFVALLGFSVLAAALLEAGFALWYWETPQFKNVAIGLAVIFGWLSVRGIITARRRSNVQLVAAFVALLAADAYTAVVIYRAVFVFGCTGECADSVFWPAIAILGLVLMGLCWLTWRVGRRLRTPFASRSARPS